MLHISISQVVKHMEVINKVEVIKKAEGASYNTFVMTHVLLKPSQGSVRLTPYFKERATCHIKPYL